MSRALSFRPGTISRRICALIDGLVADAGDTPDVAIYSSMNFFTHEFVPNASCWAATLEFSCVSPYNGAGGNDYCGTAISPLHVSFTNHNSPSSFPTQIDFVAADGTLVSRDMIDSESAGGGGNDHKIVLLDSELDASIVPVKVLPAGYERYLPAYPSDGLRVPVVNYNRGRFSGDASPCNIPPYHDSRWAKLLEVVNLAGGYITPSQPEYAPYAASILNCDSGTPFLIYPAAGVPVLVGGASWNAPHAHRAAINAAMATVDARNGVTSGYQLSDVDLDAYHVFPYANSALDLRRMVLQA